MNMEVREYVRRQGDEYREIKREKLRRRKRENGENDEKNYRQFMKNRDKRLGSEEKESWRLRKLLRKNRERKQKLRRLRGELLIG